MKCSNIITGIFNVIILLYSLLILGVGIALRRNGTTACDHSLEKQYIALGTILFVFAVAGIIGACYRVNWLLQVYLVVLVIVILIVLASVILIFVVTRKGDGEIIGGKAYKEYRLQYYSSYLQKSVKNSWKTTRSCLVEGNVCKELIDNKGFSATEFYGWILSPIQSGCCKPSNDCGFAYVAPTNWTKPTTTTAYSNPDCLSWSNNESTLCYDCDACKAGVAQRVKVAWRTSAFIDIALISFLFIVLTTGWHAVRVDQGEQYRYRTTNL